MGGTSFDVGVIRDGEPARQRRQGDRLRRAGARADDRHPHDRRRRRLDRARELGRHPAGRARERRRRSRPDLLRPRRRGADHHRRQPAARPARTRTRCSASTDGAQLDRIREICRQEDRRAPRARARSRWPARSCGSPTTRWRAPSAWCRSSAATIRATSSLFAFGGAGPLHAVALARELGDPDGAGAAPGPGITSALGCLVADVRHDFVQTVNQGVLRLDLAEAHRILAAQVDEGRRLLAAEGVRGRDRHASSTRPTCSSSGRPTC